MTWDKTGKTWVDFGVTAQPAMIRVMRGGKTVDLAQVSADGGVVMGFAAHTVYGAADGSIGLDLEILATEAGGAVIRNGSVTVTAADGSAVVAPVAGLIGCK